MARRIRALDGSRTPLGDPAAWSERLRAAVDLVLDLPRPACLSWGPDLRLLPNDAAAALLGSSDLLGRPSTEVWPGSPTGPGPDAPQGTPFDWTPLRDDRGQIAGFLGLAEPGSPEPPSQVRDAGADHPDARDLRASEERLAAIFASAAVGLSEIALDGHFLQVNDELCRILGRPREAVLRLGVPDVTHPADLAQSLSAVAEAQSSGASAGFDKRYTRPDGSAVWANSRVTLLRHQDGRPDWVLAVSADLTDRRAAELALRDSEERLRLAVEVGNLATWDWDLRSGRVAWSDEHYRMNGYAVREVEPSFEAWAARVHPEDLPGTVEQIERAREGRHDYAHEFRSLHPDGTVRWCTARGRFFYDDAGEPLRMVGVMLDVTERRSWEDRLAVLVAELQHRTRNLIGVVRSMADRTLAGAESLEDFQARFRDRLGALSRVNGLLSRLREGDRITFDELLRTELMGHGIPAGEGQGPQVVLRGPDGIRLRSASVQTFALALHELTTNALKHGALSSPEGRLEVSWLRIGGSRGQGLLRVEWCESGGPGADRESRDPPRRGYGRELIERALPYQLGAETSYELRPDGVRCTITLPVSGPAEPLVAAHGRTAAV
jgi:PAS domain S-box-containing protein